jgi:hypothetical protein
VPYISAETSAAFRGIYNLGMFLRLDTDPALHLWWGVGDIKAAIPDLDVDGTVYIGGGVLTEVPDGLEMLINGRADKADWILSGVSPEHVEALVKDDPGITGKSVTFAAAPLDDYWQLKAPPVPLWVGTAERWVEHMAPQENPTKSRVLSLVMSVTSGDTTRSLPYYATWTDRDQRIVSAFDLFCARVSRYYPGQAIKWPRF